MLSVVSDKNFIKFYAMGWIAAYLVTYFFLKNYLPDEYFRDSQTIQKLATVGDGTDEWLGAYGVAAFFQRVLPPFMIMGIVATIGSFTIWTLITSVKTVRGIFLILPVLIPCIVLNMMTFGKESFVIPMTFLILWVTRKSRSIPHAIAGIIFIYVVYGLFFRDYYLIILAAFLGCIILQKSSLPFRCLSISVGILVLFALPSSLFMELQGDRDRINYIASMILVVHTAITNPLPPNSAWHFIVNYLFASLRLLMPFAFRLSASDIVLFLNVLIFGRLVYVGVKNRWMGAVSYLPLLFIAHILVLIIFEPDAGSFLRHVTSVVLYLVPALQLVENRRAEQILLEEKKKKALKALA